MDAGKAELSRTLFLFFIFAVVPVWISDYSVLVLILLVLFFSRATWLRSNQENEAKSVLSDTNANHSFYGNPIAHISDFEVLFFFFSKFSLDKVDSLLVAAKKNVVPTRGCSRQAVAKKSAAMLTAAFRSFQNHDQSTQRFSDAAHQTSP